MPGYQEAEDRCQQEGGSSREFHLLDHLTDLSTEYVTAVWNTYTPSWVELSILAWSFAWFGMFFIAFLKLFPVVAIAEMKELAIHEKDHAHGGAH